MFKKLAEQLKTYNNKANTAPVTQPFGSEFLTAKNTFLSNLSKKAVNLYEKQSEIKQLTKLVLSEPDNKSHDVLVNKLFEDGVVDPFVDDKLEQLADNKKLLKDLGLL